MGLDRFMAFFRRRLPGPFLVTVDVGEKVTEDVMEKVTEDVIEKVTEDVKEKATEDTYIPYMGPGPVPLTRDPGPGTGPHVCMYVDNDS